MDPSSAMNQGKPLEVWSELEEEKWVNLAKGGDRQAISRLIDAYDRKLGYFVLGQVSDPDQGKEVMQNVWLAVVEGLPTLRENQKFRGWVYKIAHNLCMGLSRSECRERQAQERFFRRRSSGGEASGYTDVERAVIAAEDAAIVHRTLERLSRDHRTVLILCFIEDMPEQEVADVMGCCWVL